NPVSRRVLAAQLCELGLRCRTVATAAELRGLGEARRHFDFALIDVDLLGPDPITTWKHLQAEGGWPARMALTDHFGHPHDTGAHRLEGCRWLAKPLGRDGLLQWLRSDPTQRRVSAPTSDQTFEPPLP